MNNNSEIYNSPEYKRSRQAYTFECAFEHFVALLVSGVFLAKLLGDIGMDDALIGIISSFISLSFLFQLFSVFVGQRISNTKRFVTLFHSLSQVFFMSLYLIPFLPFEYKHKEILVIVCILAAYFGNYFVTSMIYQWGNSHVHPNHRARFSATKEMISLAFGIIVSLAAGYVIDSFELGGNLKGGFLFIAVSIFIFSACDFTCLMLIKNRIKSPEEKKQIAPMREVFKNIIGNKNYLTVIVLQILWSVSAYTTTGFMGTYVINPHELAFSVGAAQLITILGHGSRCLISRPFGRFSDKHSYAKGIELGLILAAVSFSINIFTTPATRFFYVGYMIIHSVCYAGIGQNMFNITYNFVDSKYIAEAMAIKNCIGGICGFGASILASKLLKHIQDSGNTFLGMNVYGQQVLSAISLLILIAAIIFTKLVIEKQKTMVQ